MSTTTLTELRRYDPTYRLLRRAVNILVVIELLLMIWFSQGGEDYPWLAWAIVAVGAVFAISAVGLLVRTLMLRRRAV
jgi:hypothetical protein